MTGKDIRTVRTEKGLTLIKGELSMCGDFTSLLSRLKQPNLSRELLVRAAKIKGSSGRELFAIDATAGMGEDALLLAAAGFRVRMYEYDPVIAALLADTIERAKNEKYLDRIVKRMELICGDSIAAMRETDIRPDVILLDPMFPERSKSALIKKKFQLLQELERPCANEEELLEAAISARPKKIIIKRPAKGPYLAGRKPDYVIEGKAVRYDCLVFA